MSQPDDAGAADPPAIVLVVEDDPLQRMDMCDMVRDAGYLPVEARDARHAVAILERRQDIRVVFTDIDMPGAMDGMRLAAIVRHRWPPVEIIVTTAGRAPALDTLPARAVFLPKPLDGERAGAALRRFVQHTR